MPPSCPSHHHTSYSIFLHLTACTATATCTPHPYPSTTPHLAARTATCTHTTFLLPCTHYHAHTYHLLPAPRYHHPHPTPNPHASMAAGTVSSRGGCGSCAHAKLTCCPLNSTTTTTMGWTGSLHYPCIWLDGLVMEMGRKWGCRLAFLPPLCRHCLHCHLASLATALPLCPLHLLHGEAFPAHRPLPPPHPTPPPSLPHHHTPTLLTLYTWFIFSTHCASALHYCTWAGTPYTYTSHLFPTLLPHTTPAFRTTSPTTPTPPAFPPHHLTPPTTRPQHFLAMANQQQTYAVPNYRHPHIPTGGRITYLPCGRTPSPFKTTP